MTRLRDNIVQHYRTAHNWKNPRGRGGNTRRPSLRNSHTEPWATGVYCQRFFRSQLASGWFEVLPPPRHSLTAATPSLQGQDPDQGFLLAYRAVTDTLQRHTTTIEYNEHKAEPNQWLNRVGWAKHLQGCKALDLYYTVSLDSNEGWLWLGNQNPTTQATTTQATTTQAITQATARANELQATWDSLVRIIQQAQLSCSEDRAGLAVLFEIQRRWINKEPAKPFDARLEPTTVDQYTNVWKRVIGYAFRTVHWPKDRRPPYKLTSSQRQQFRLFRSLLGRITALSTEEELDRVDHTGLQFLITLLDHQLLDSAYNSVLLSVLAVIGLQEDSSWLGLENYTRFYSAVIKITRMLVIQQSELEAYSNRNSGSGSGSGSNGGSNGGSGSGSSDSGSDSNSGYGPGLFSIVRQKAHRFLTSTHHNNLPTPIDWIFKSRSYGLKICYTTTLAGHVSWLGNTIIYRQIQLRMDGLVNLMHLLVAQLNRTIEDLALIRYDDTCMPSLDWDQIFDDVGEDQPGYCFLQDPQNDGWASGHQDWIIQCILKNPGLKTQWLVGQNSSHSGQDQRFHTKTVDSYLRQVDRFRGLLFIAIHLLSGQPSRTTELLSLRYMNTPYGGHRNIFIQNKMVMVVTLYHKGYRISGHVKVVQRYLPKELSQLVILYLWLILPFAQGIQAMASKGGQRSAFLWATAFVRSDSPEQAAQRPSEQKQQPDLRLWPADKVQRAFQEATHQHLGFKVNISA